MVSLNFNANDVDPSVGSDPLPAGNYLAIIVESEMKPTKNGNGHFLELCFEVVDGPHKGRKLWSRLNLDNPNQQAVQIARSELSSICRAVGVMTPNDSCELHNLPLSVSVKVIQRQDNGEPANEIRGYAKKEVAADQPAQATNSTPPWMRRP